MRRGCDTLSWPHVFLFAQARSGRCRFVTRALLPLPDPGHRRCAGVKAVRLRVISIAEKMKLGLASRGRVVDLLFEPPSCRPTRLNHVSSAPRLTLPPCLTLLTSGFDNSGRCSEPTEWGLETTCKSDKLVAPEAAGQRLQHNQIPTAGVFQRCTPLLRK